MSKDIRDLIVEEIEKQERNLLWLSKKTDIPYPTIYSLFKLKTFMPTQEKVDVINKVLGTNFSL